jgi:transposase InsO family protein
MSRIRGSKSAQEAVHWSREMEASFVAVKQALSKATWLAHPDPSDSLALHVDASASHVGAALHQRIRGCSGWQPLGFFSRKLDTAQTRWSAFDRELFVCVEGIRHFRFILEGRAFTVFTDHKPLVGALARTSDPWTARQCRHLAYVAEFTSDVQHVAGQDNLVADALSRPPVATLVPPSSPRGTSASSDLAGLAFRQRGCADTQQAQTSSSLQVQASELQGVSLLCDFSTGRPRPLVPKEDRKQIFEAVHGVAHPGIRASRRMIAAWFVWLGMKADIAAWCRECEGCQRAKVTKQPRAPLQPIHIPSRRFSHVHVDLVGPLPASEGGLLYLFTVIDRTTRWLEATPLKEASTASCISAFLSSWVAHFGVPETVTTDRGAQFSSATWAFFCRQAGLRHVMTTAYHPQANGLVERAHRQLKAAFRARGAGIDWPAHLPWVLLGLHAAPKEISGVSSAEAIYGEQLVLPGDFNAGLEVPPLAFKEELASSQPPPTCQPRTYAEVASQPPNSTLQTAEYVYVRRGGVAPPLAPTYSGPYKVARAGPKCFLLEIGGRQEMVSVDRLKPHTGSTPPSAAEPPRRGRPPNRPPLLLQPSRKPRLGGGPCRGRARRSQMGQSVSKKSANM